MRYSPAVGRYRGPTASEVVWSLGRSTETLPNGPHPRPMHAIWKHDALGHMTHDPREQAHVYTPLTCRKVEKKIKLLFGVNLVARSAG